MLLPTHRYAYSLQHLPRVVVRDIDDAMKEAEEEQPDDGVEPSEEKDEGGEQKGEGSNPTPVRRCTMRCHGTPPTLRGGGVPSH